MKYKFRYKKGLFWKTVKVIGHGIIKKFVRDSNGFKVIKNKEGKTEEDIFEMEYDKDIDKMVLYLENGGIKEISNWSNCECELGLDWVLETKKAMERSIGQTIPMDIKEK